MSGRLATEDRLERPDDLYELLTQAHQGLTPEQSRLLNAKLILLLANHIGDLEVVREAVAIATRERLIMSTRVDEIDRSRPLEMAYARRKAEQIVTGLEDPINQHLIKLLAFEGGSREHWLRELDAWLTRIAAIVWTRTNRPFDADFYRRILFDEPFGGVEARNVGALTELIVRQYGPSLRRNEIDVAGLVAALRRFHEDLADAFAQGNYDPSLLDGLRQGSFR